MTEEKNVPEIRFKGFTHAWEQRKLGDECSFSKGRGYNKSDLVETGIPILLYGQLYTDYRTTIESVDTCVTPRDGSVYSSGVEVVVPASGETAEDIAIASHISCSKVILGGDLNIITPGKHIDSSFLALSITYSNAHKALAKAAQGKSVVHVRNSDIARLVIPLPSLEEQYQIGAYFKNLDSLITLHQRKYDKLVQTKKAMLDKMFPKPGETVPEIRFKGFTHAWEQRKLGEIADIVGGNAWKSDAYSEVGDYLVVTIANVCGGYYIDDSIGNMINAAPHNPYRLDKGDILVSLTGNVGRVSRMTGIPAVLNQRVGKITLKTGLDNEFVFQSLRTGEFEKEMTFSGQGAAQKNIGNNVVLGFQLRIPVVDEQQKIGAYFKNLDSLITLHQRKSIKIKIEKF